MIYLLSIFLLLSSSGTVLSQNTDPELVLSPDSRLLPVGKNATFTCKFRDVHINHFPFWQVNQTEASNDHNKGELKRKGFNILNDQQDNNGITILTLVVNSSYAGVNNTMIQCRTLTDVQSELATILTIADPPFSPNPLLEQPSTMSSILSLKWSPPFLWPGYYIRNYNISVRDDSGEKLSTYQVNSTTFSKAVMALSLDETYHICMEFSFEITPEHRDITGQSRYVKGGYYAPLGDHEFDVSAMVFFRADGTPLVRALVKPSDKICSYQELSIAINITDRASNALVTNNSPLPHRGNGSFEYDITSSNLKMKMEYLMIVTVYTGFESSTFSYSFNTSLDPDLYPTNPSCIHVTGASRNGQNTQLFTYKVAMGACLGLAALMLLTLGIVFICFLIHRQRRISQGKNLNVSTNRMQNAMVHNPIYDGPVYESVQPHFDTLTTTVKQDLSLSNTSASNSPPRSSTPPNIGSGNNSQRMVRYLDQPIQLRSQSLSHASTPDNNNPRSTSTVCAQAARVTGLKKNGKERNKLHLTLTLNGSESGNPTSGAPQCGKDEDVVLAGDLLGNQGGNKKRAVVSDGDENYTVMSPIKRKDSGNIGGGVIELSPEDTIKYKEEVN